jgi:hypothetical protein
MRDGRFADGKRFNTRAPHADQRKLSGNEKTVSEDDQKDGE